MKLPKIPQVNWMKVLIGFSLSTVAIFGLSVHIFTIRTRKFYISRAMVAYSLVVATVFLLVYGQDIAQDFAAQQFDLKNAVKLYSYMNIMSSVISYLTCWYMAVQLQTLLNSITVFRTLETFHLDKNIIKSSILTITLKIIVLPLVIEMTLLVRQVRNEPDRHMAWTLYTLFPTVIANIYPNCFFVVVVTCKLLIYSLNQQIEEVLNAANCMQTPAQLELQQPYYRMQRFCELADKLDLICEKYIVVCTRTQECCAIISVPYLLALLCNLFGMTSGFFTQYLAVTDSLVNDEPYDVFNSLTNFVYLLTSVGEIAMHANVCQNNVMTVRETGIILQRMNLQHADVRFKNAVEAFSLRILVSKYKIQPLGLLEIDIALIHDMFSTVTSFLLILIQSDLTLRFSLK